MAEASAGGGRVTAEVGGRWLYYLTLAIGIERTAKDLIWVLMVLLCKTYRKVEKIKENSCGN